MKKLFVVKDETSSTFHLLTYDYKCRNNVGYIDQKEPNLWRLYTSVGSTSDFKSRYHHFSTFNECISKLQKLSTKSKVEVKDRVWVNKLIKEEELENEINLELEAIVGLKNIKQEIKELFSLAQVRNTKIESGIGVNPPNLHMVFYGNPGTGKTSIARIIARIYNKIGLLGKDTFIETSRADLVGEHIGETAIKTTAVFNKALGGVLFIDEAYSLYNESKRDFGYESINTLMKLMEDNRNNIAVIIAGYTKEMELLLNSNPGIKGRFSSFMFFKDYSKPELLQIINVFFREIKHVLTRGAEYKLDFLVEELYSEGYFKANARSARNLFEKIIKNQAKRLSGIKVSSKEELSTIIPEDIPDLSFML